jgi:Tol biopolymer transport system component
MQTRIHPLVILGVLMMLPVLACTVLFPRAGSSAASPGTALPAGTAAGEDLPSGGCADKLGKVVLSYDSRDIESVHYGISLMDSDSGNRIRLSSPDEMTDTDPAWSPDRCSIAFTRFTEGGDNDIYAMSADGKSIRRLTTDPARDMFPDWSPDGKQIVFVSCRDGYRNLFVMNADGSGQRQLTSNKQDHSQWEQWSPNGDQIAFTYNAGTGQGTSIFVIRPDGTGLHQVAPPAGELGDREPTWSPDGRKLYVIFNRSSHEEIWEMNADGSRLRQITRFGGDLSPDHSPRVSPEGTQLAFYGTGPEVVTNSTEIYVINVDGSGLKNISNAKGADEWLDW